MPMTEEELEYKAQKTRESLGYGPLDSISAVEFLERYKATKVPSLVVAIVPDTELPYAEAESVPSQNIIKFRKSTYDSAVSGDCRAKFTVIEEVCHDLLRHSGAMHRAIANDFIARANPKKWAQEREAKYLAAAIIAPQAACVSLDSADEIASQFGLSAEAAKIRYNQTDRARRKARGETRAFSSETIERVRKLEAVTGYRVRSLSDD